MSKERDNSIGVADKALAFLSEVDSVILTSSQQRCKAAFDRIMESAAPSLNRFSDVTFYDQERGEFEEIENPLGQIYGYNDCKCPRHGIDQLKECYEEEIKCDPFWYDSEDQSYYHLVAYDGQFAITPNNTIERRYYS